MAALGAEEPGKALLMAGVQTADPYLWIVLMENDGKTGCRWKKMLKDADIQRGMDHSLNLMRDELCTTNASESVSPEMDQL